jgi:hypothetical protein
MLMKTLIAALTLLPVGYVLALQAQNAAPVQETPWFPLKEGNHWHYRVVAGEVPGAKKNAPPRKNEDAAKKVAMRADKLVPLEFMKDDKAGKPEKVSAMRFIGTSEDRELNEHVAVLADGVYKFAGGDKDVTPPLRILKLPVVLGEKWDCNVAVEGGAVKGTFTLLDKEEVIKIGKDTYKTLHVSGEFMVGSQKMTADYWFASGVGIVKYSTKKGTFNVVLELEKFESR